MRKFLITDYSIGKNHTINKNNVYQKKYDFTIENFSYNELYLTNWDKICNENEKKWKNQFHENLSFNDEIHFQGLTAIPIAFHLGSLVGNIPKVFVKNLHHKSKSWEYEEEVETVKIISDCPSQSSLIESKGDVIIRVFTSHQIDDKKTKNLVPDLIKPFEIKSEQLGEDILQSLVDVENVTKKFKELLDWIDNNLPKCNKIHLFTSVPVGLAFLLGTKISPTMHKSIVLYQYDSNVFPFHHKAIEIKNNNLEKKLITEEQKNQLKNDFENLKYEFSKIQTYIQNLSEKKIKNWLNDLFPKFETKNINLANLNSLNETDLFHSKIEYLIGESDFYSKEKKSWILSEELLFQIHKQFSNHEDKLKAFRIFLFHECIHSKQRLNSSTSFSIGVYDRITEIIDYQADVYAFLNEFGFNKHFRGDRNLKSSLLSSILIGIKTMWSFVPEENDLIEKRRFIRFLNWYFQYCKILNTREENENDLINIILEKPNLDIRGIQMEIRDERIYFDLSSALNKPEIGIFENNQLKKIGELSSLNLKDFILYMKEKNHEKLIESMKKIYDHI